MPQDEVKDGVTNTDTTQMARRGLTVDQLKTLDFIWQTVESY